jgi:YesN/AraC family two-component response regulator
MYKLLIVDDHKHLVQSLATTIPWEDYEITEVYQAYSGYEAIELMSIHSIHVLVTDIRMPGISGLELIERVRAEWPLIDSILLTGHSEFQYAKRAIELQAISYLLKPVRDEELIQAVQSAIGKQIEQVQSIQRNAKALEEAVNQSLNDERKRIAYDLHDTVGHMLTGTLIQIEAAKQLLSRNQEEGLTKLDHSQDLIRQGLRDVRETVYGMVIPKKDSSDLKGALQRFVAEVEHNVHISVTCSIEISEPITDEALIKAVVLACKEGITNGTRHGLADQFELVVSKIDETLELRLWNNGIPYDGVAPLGFGLRAMSERMSRWGGILTLHADAARQGSILTLKLPRL